MLLTISTTRDPATDLGYLLMKNPGNVHERDLWFGKAVIFFPEASRSRCTATLMLDIDPIGLVRGKDAWSQGLFGHYVTDRPYAVSSFMSVAISRLLGTAMSGRSRERQALADTPIPLEAVLCPLPCRGGVKFLERLFAPLGYEVAAEQFPLDPVHPEWGDSAYIKGTLTGNVRLADLLTHLYVLLPVLDNQKHYFVGSDEVEKLLSKGAGWLEHHPEKEAISRRYLKNRAGLTRWALEALAERVAAPDAETAEAEDEAEEELETPIRLNEQRLGMVARLLAESGARRVLDVGCGEGKLLRRLLKEKQFERIVGVDVSLFALARAEQGLRLTQMTPRERSRIDLLHGSLVYCDSRLTGFDAAAAIEVIEHLELDRLAAFEAALFGSARPTTIVISTPNKEFNALFPNIDAGGVRHPDHRFEWTREEFRTWANSVAERYGYDVRFAAVGDAHEEFGSPTQVGVFSR